MLKCIFAGWASRDAIVTNPVGLALAEITPHSGSFGRTNAAPLVMYQSTLTDAGPSRLTPSMSDPNASPPSYPDTEKSSGHDVEKNVGDGVQTSAVVVGGWLMRLNADPNSAEGAVQRRLKARHLAMIALGGTIGTGLFVGSGGALANGGPVEMATLFPVAGGFTHYATRCKFDPATMCDMSLTLPSVIDPAVGFALGYNYWYSYAITLPTELTASAIVIQYWNTTINVSVWITILYVLILIINFMGVRWYGEFEFWFSAIKITTIVGLIILGICLDCGAGPASTGYIGFRYWKDPGPFNQITINNGEGVIPGSWGRTSSHQAAIESTAFSFLGTEIIAVTVGEAENPRRNVPKAIRRVFWRILLFYVLGIFIIGLLVPYNSDELLNNSGSDASASPFVIAIKTAGIKGLPSVINAVILISAWSAGNSDLYASSRTLYALALEHKAPAFLRRCTKGGLPVWTVIITGLFGLLAYLNAGSQTAVTVFNWLYNISSITGLITWFIILVSYLRMYYGLKKQGISRDDFPYKAPFQPYASWFGAIFVFLVLLFNGFTVFLRGNWDVTVFLAAYICIPIFVVFYLYWKIAKRTKWVRLEDIDFVTGRRELDEVAEQEEARYQAPKGFWQKLWDWMF
ncbi:amino acid transporter [Rhizoctonia solani AG-1 IA]|uniref:Amino acid transporter n=1 Tax=Thanatephorus cucumeris (strain AG1-IA) TaxID=983506 RepID=L8X1L7_THACA|nr:amino acid transporter [Rhizoctonia solani AG-1 IA]